MTSKMFIEISEQNDDLKKVREYYQRESIELLREIKTYQRLILMGTGASFQAALAAWPAFLLHSTLEVEVIAASENNRIDRLKESDLVILISQSGNSVETIEAINKLQEKKINFWALCNNENSCLWKKSQRQLPILAENEEGSATKSYSCSLYALYHLAGGEEKRIIDDLGIIIDDNQKTIEVMPGRAKSYALNLGQQPVMYLAGIGDASSVATQAAIVLKEKAYLHASGMSITEFRHGTVEVISEKLPIILIALGEEDYQKAIKHQQYLTGLSADCQIVSEQASCPLCFYNSLPPEFGLLNAQVFFQYLAEAIAINRNLAVDEFKYLSKTVDHY